MVMRQQLVTGGVWKVCWPVTCIMPTADRQVLVTYAFFHVVRFVVLADWLK